MKTKTGKCGCNFHGFCFSLLLDGVLVCTAALWLWRKPRDINPASWQTRRCGKEMWTYVVTTLTSFSVLEGLGQQEVRREERGSCGWWGKRQENCAGGGRGEERSWNLLLGREEGVSVWNMKPWEAGDRGGGAGGGGWINVGGKVSGTGWRPRLLEVCD